MMEESNKVETRGQAAPGVGMGSQFKAGWPGRMTPRSQRVRNDGKRGESAMRGVGSRAAGRKEGPLVDRTMFGIFADSQGGRGRRGGGEMWKMRS